MVYAALRMISIFCLIASILGCISVPNYKRSQINNNSEVPAKHFKYGKFCGAGHPSFKSKPGSRQRTDDLQSIWPPIDDIDILCYAHDLCYQMVGSQNLICDQALSATAVASVNDYNQISGCRNLVKLIGSGLGAKVTGTEKSKRGSIIITVANAIWTLPVSVLYYSLNYSQIKKYGYPGSEETCFINNTNILHTYQVISDFEANYREYAKGFKKYSFSTPGRMSVSIPVPIDQWDRKYLIFETQKFLNYFGYNAGISDGVLGKKTYAAISKFSAEHGLVNNNIKYVNHELKRLYLLEPRQKRIDLVNSSYEEKKKIFGYE